VACVRRGGWIAALILINAAGGGPAHAADSTASVTVETVPNIEAVSVYAVLVGDDNRNASATFEFRESPSGAWKSGVPMHRMLGQRRFASFFFAAPATAYDVVVRVADPDGVLGAGLITTSVTTRDDQAPSPGAILYVAATGADTNPGTSDQPLRTIGKAIERSHPGDTITIAPGIYRESVRVSNRAGAPASWLTIQGNGTGPVVLDGSDPALLATGQNRWDPYQSTIFRTPMAVAPESYVAVDGLRAYHFPTLAALTTGAAGVPAGWVHESGFLYLRTKDGSDPDGHVIQVATLLTGVDIDRSAFVRIRNLTFRFFSDSAIHLNGTEHDILIEDNVLANNGHGIRKGGQGGGPYTIQRNTISDTEVSTWPWHKVKKSEHEAAGIGLFAADAGVVVRDNTISGYFDGIDFNMWPPTPGYDHDADINRNTILDAGDDGVELEGSDMTNARFWSNTMVRCFDGVSVDPVLLGPVYVIRNTASWMKMQGFKVGSAGADSVGAVYAFHNTLHVIDDVNNDDDGVQCTNPPGFQNHTYRNNVFSVGRYVVVHGDCATTNVTYDYDLVFTKDPTRFAQWDGRVRHDTFAAWRSATGQELHGIAAPAQFVSVDGNDMRLVPGSPGTDAAAVIPGINDADSPWPFVGKAPDMGALEVDAQRVNHPPVLAPIADATVVAGKTLRVAVSATDPDGDALVFSVQGLPGATVTDGVLQWTPSSAQVGIFPSIVIVSDGLLQDSGAFTVTVTSPPPPPPGNQPPVLGPIAPVTVNEGAPVNVLFTASDPDGQPLTFSITGAPLGSTLNGAQFSWTSTAGHVGVCHMTVSVTDGQASDSRDFMVTVRALVPPPSTSFAIGGQVLDVAGLPVSGVTVKLSGLDRYLDGRPTQATTDAQGRFRLAELQTTRRIDRVLATCPGPGCAPIAVQIEAVHPHYRILNPTNGRRDFKLLVDPAHPADRDLVAKAVPK